MTDYDGFEVKVDNDNGSVTLTPGATVEVRDFTDPEAVVRLMPDLVADGAGWVASGSLAVPAGTPIRFTWKDDDTGICGFAEQETF